ncbi:MAG TPA: two-component sensor histidine kinase [Treponema sp.]|nr:two-component sensor histidine kinase [Treponema sp.]
MNDFVKKASQKISKLSHDQVERLVNTLISQKESVDSIIQSLSTGLLIVSQEWILLQTNKAAERLLPFSVRPGDSKAESLPVWELIDNQQISDYLKSCILEQKTNVSEDFSIEAGEKYRFITISVLPLVERIWQDDDSVSTRISGSIITVDDITEKRQSEILLHRMESLASLTNLAASVAHEIKNPLGAISIHIQLLQKAVAKARAKDGLLPKEKFMEDYIRVINEEIDNLNKIVVDFLFAVRPVQANMQLAEPDSIVESFASFFAPEFESKNIKASLRLCKTSPRLLIDEKLFREVLINITQNALAAIASRFPSGAGSSGEDGELLIESEVKDERYILTIADNGCGMDEKTASHIFEPYYTTKASGTGLGLTTVYKIIKEFRGDIAVKSVENHGTIFTVSLPVPQKGTLLLPDNSNKEERSK